MINIITKPLEFEEELKKKIEKATQHLNNEMDEAAEEFYQTKKNKEKDDGLSL